MQLQKATEVNPSKPFLLDGEAVTKMSLALKQVGEAFNMVLSDSLEQIKNLQSADVHAIQKAASTFNGNLEEIQVVLNQIWAVLTRNADLEYKTLQNINAELAK